MFCKNCRVYMNEVLSCDNGKFYKFHRCPRCYSESKRVLYQFVEDANDALNEMGKPKTKKKQNNKHENNNKHNGVKNKKLLKQRKEDKQSIRRM